MKKIKDFNYSITEQGRIFSHYRNRFLINVLINFHGYKYIPLWKNGKRFMKKVHRLIAQAYIPNPYDKPFINHINGIKTDNSLKNLEWCTYLENMKHAHETKLIDNKGSKNGMSKLTKEDVWEIRKLGKENKFNKKEIAKMFNVNRNHIDRILAGTRWGWLKNET